MRLIIETPEGDQAHPLPEGTTIIGRESSCNIRIHDPSVSRRHLECALTAGILLARDLNTRNGTWLGPQRVEEVHVTPGLRLCLGTVHIRFEAEIEEAAPRPIAPQPVLSEHVSEAMPAQAAPIEDDFEQDDEPTPLDENVAQSVLTDAAGKGTRLVVRGNKWFVQDSATGAEVEIVPQQGAEQPTAPGDEAIPGDAAPVPASLMPMVVTPRLAVSSVPAEPATATPISPAFNLKALLADPRKRRLVLIGAAGFVALLILAVLWFKPPQKPKALSSARYRAIADEAVLAFDHDKRADALARLDTLARQPVQGRHKLANILLDAFKSDARTLTGFRASWEDAQARWEEVRDSSETTERAQELARKRLDWITVELENMVHTNEAKAHLQRGNLVACLNRASEVPEDSLFHAEAAALIAQTVTTVVDTAERKAAEAAAAQKWADAIAHLQAIKEYQPARASDIDPRIETFRLRIVETAAVAQARKLAGENRHAEAIEQLNDIAADSPYAKDAESLKKRFALDGTRYQAMAAYAAGDGEKALAFLAEGGLGDDALARKIQAVLEHRKNADKALEAKDFDEATQEIEGLLAVETNDKNRYHQMATRQLANMAELRTSYGQQLMAEAEAAKRGRMFTKARSLYLTVVRIDPASRTEALAELKNLRDAAVNDVNTATALQQEHPERALKIYQDVMNRLSPEHEFYGKAEMRILALDLRMELDRDTP